MKRFTMWLRELSLVQQLLLIIFSFLIILAVFILLFLSRSIDRFSETEMYRILHNSQETIVTYMNNHEGEVPLFHYSSDASITDAVYDVNNDELYILSGKSISPQLMQDIKHNSAMQNAVTQDYKMVPIEEQEDGKAALSILYSMTKTENGAMVVSVMEDDYRMQFRQSLVSGVVFANILFVSILFALLMLWVSSLIIPLSQIKSYITKIKNEDKSATLNIRRHDEIGEVANALIDMESQLDKQSKDKEEMIQNISHDLKTPIATIKSYGEAIKDGIYPYETLEKSVDVIIEHADRLEKKVKSLIMLNKMGYLLDTKEDGENLLMNEIVEKVILSVKAIRPEILFIRDMPDDVYFHGEEEPWRIVIENLVENALRYAESYIIIRLREGELSVSNDGKKIEVERLKSLFKPYEKGDDGKFGLGLSIVHKVATTYGYSVRAENLSDGVCFRIFSKNQTKKSNKKNKGKS